MTDPVKKTPAPVAQPSTQAVQNESKWKYLNSIKPDFKNDTVWNSAVKVLACATILFPVLAALIDITNRVVSYFASAKKEKASTAEKSAEEPPKAESRLKKVTNLTKEYASKSVKYVKAHPYYVAGAVLTVGLSVLVYNYVDVDGLFAKNSNIGETNTTVVCPTGLGSNGTHCVPHKA